MLLVNGTFMTNDELNSFVIIEQLTKDNNTTNAIELLINAEKYNVVLGSELDKLIETNSDIRKAFLISKAKELHNNLSCEFTFKGFIYTINDYSEGGWYVDVYNENALKDEDDYYKDEDSIDGGLCTGNAFNAVNFMLNKEDAFYDDYFVIEASTNFDTISSDAYKPFIVEIGQEKILSNDELDNEDDSPYIECYENIIKKEFYATKEDAHKRVKEINSLFTNDLNILNAGE